MKKSRNTPHGFKTPAKGGANFKWGKKTYGHAAKSSGGFKSKPKGEENKTHVAGSKDHDAKKYAHGTPAPVVNTRQRSSTYDGREAGLNPKVKSEEARKYDERNKAHFKKKFEGPKLKLPAERAADEKYSDKPKWDNNSDLKAPKTGPDNEFDQGMKLQQYLAHAGVTSRRKAEEFIEQGRVMVNGKTVIDVTARVRAGRDHVKFDGSLIREEKPVYILMNKPEGCISAISDPENRKTVVDIVKPFVKARVYPVGRLDFNTTGTLILTNDGDFANKVMHPKFEIEKKYVAKVQGRISSFSLKKLVTGVRIEEGRVVKALNAGVYKRNDQNDQVFIVIKEGMNHQVKRMLQAVGASVVRLRRENIGLITDKGLNPGQWRYMTPAEIKYLTGE